MRDVILPSFFIFSSYLFYFFLYSFVRLFFIITLFAVVPRHTIITPLLHTYIYFHYREGAKSLENSSHITAIARLLFSCPFLYYFHTFHVAVTCLLLEIHAEIGE